MAAAYKFARRVDGSYRCESSVAGEGSCLVRRNPARSDEWQTSTVPTGDDVAVWITTPVADCFFTRLGAVMAHFFYHRKDT